MENEFEEKLNSEIRKKLWVLLNAGVVCFGMMILSVPIGIYFGIWLGVKTFFAFLFLTISCNFLYGYAEKKIRAYIQNKIDNGKGI